MFLPLYFPTTSFLFLVQSKTGALEGPEVDGFVKDMMGLVRVRVCSLVHLMFVMFVPIRVVLT